MERRFGEEARRIRVSRRISAREVARQLGYSPVYISDIERGARKPPTPDVAAKWAALIGADPTEFERLAAAGHDSVEVPLQNVNVALALARRKTKLTPEQEDQVLRILNQENSDELQS